MISQLLPFWVKYWYYISITFFTFIIVNILLNRMSRIVANKTTFSNLQENLSDNFEDVSSENEPALPKDLKHIIYKYTKPSNDEMRKRSLNFYNNINSRRTLRFFSSESIPRDILYNIIKAAGTAPSGAHTEPWTFVLVSSKKVKLQVREIVEKEEVLNYTKRMGKKWIIDLEPLKTNWVKEYLTDAPYLIFLFKQTYGILPDGQKKNHYYNEMSASIAAGILITAIHFAGLVTLTSTPLNCGPALRLLLNRPQNEKLVLLLPVGYPAADATVPDLSRKTLSDILVEIK